MKFIDINREGSPPRVRGKASTNGLYPTFAGITPAYAGKSCSSRRCCGCRWDHPRVCGEKDKAAEKAQHLRGSPPRMQGKVYFLQQGDFTIRITPAYAGKRPWLAAYCARCGDHPRVCGEKKQLGGTLDDTAGSPPHVRGKAGRGGQNLARRGITPAYAGKRPGWADSGCQRGDHPRVCGEKCK